MKDALIGSGLYWFQASEQLLERRAEEARERSRDSKAEVNGSLIIHFVHDDPDLTIEVPAVPGRNRRTIWRRRSSGNERGIRVAQIMVEFQ